MKEKISPFQFFAAVFFVPYGTAAILFLTPKAKQDSWLVIIMYMLPALLLQSIYITLYKRYPQDTLITWLPKIFRKLLGKVLSSLYIIYFTYIATRALRDIVEIVSKTAMFGTPLWILTVVLMITVTHGVYTGVENMCRIASTYFVFLMLLITSLIILYFATPNIIEWKNLLPIFPEGIIDAVVKNWRLITFPYGETIIATMLYVHVNEPKKIKRSAFAAIIVEGIALAFVHVCYVIGLGANFAPKELFPLMDALRLIRVTGFLDRLDLFAIVVIIFNGFIKIGFLCMQSQQERLSFLE